MAFRNRPVLDRKHRPRWQDELRMQQLLVAGFAVAIAIAVGIFAAAAWSTFFETNLRQSALVGGVPVDRSAVLTRVNIQAAELQAKGTDLVSEAGGMTGDRFSQQLQGIQTALNQVRQSGADSLVTGMVLDRRAADYGLSVTPAAIDAEIDKRMHFPERRQLSLIMASPRIPVGIYSIYRPVYRTSYSGRVTRCACARRRSSRPPRFREMRRARSRHRTGWSCCSRRSWC